MPKRTLSVLDGTAIVVGIVIGMGIFKSPSLVAGAAGSVEAALGLWVLGGILSLLGALTYAELFAAYPDRGGEYTILGRAYHSRLAFLFGWARLTVIQPGTIAGAGFVIGDYLTPYLGLGPQSPAVYAAIAVALVTFINLRGLTLTAGLQNLLSLLLLVCLIAIIAAAFLAPAAPAPATQAGLPAMGAVGFAMIFVLLTYGGWNEAAYLSGDVANPQRDMFAILLGGVGLVTVLYVGVNWAYLHVLGVEGVAKAGNVGAAAAGAEFGPAAAGLVTLFVLAACVSTMNGTLFTGARSAFALGRDSVLLKGLSGWSDSANAPVAGIIVQSAISLVLVGLAVAIGAGGESGFSTMVAYTAPVFWVFFALTAIAAIVLRVRDPNRDRPFKTPLFPLPPALFAAAALYMLYTGMDYALSIARKGEAAFAIGAGFGLSVLAVGFVLMLFARPTLAAAPKS
jgi:amino acid transporter